MRIVVSVPASTVEETRQLVVHPAVLQAHMACNTMLQPCRLFCAANGTLHHPTLAQHV